MKFLANFPFFKVPLQGHLTQFCTDRIKELYLAFIFCFMFDAFEQYIKKIIPELTEEQIRLMQTKSVVRLLRKKENLLQEGEICVHKTFVTQGLLRIFSIGGNGAEHILRFVDAGNWIIDPESYFNDLPSIYNIDAIEPSEVVLFHRNDFRFLSEHIPELNKHNVDIFKESVLTLHNRIHLNISATPEEKYKNFIETHPDIFQRIPLYMVASYLGLSRETLTRVRQRLDRK